MKGNPNITAILNHLLAGELTAIDQYLLHGEMYANLGLHHLADRTLHESEHERQHARSLMQRILFLEAMPDMTKRGPLNIGNSVPDMLQADLNLEYHVDGELRKAIAACEAAQDYVTRDMLTTQMEDTEMDHAYWLEQQLRLIAMVGLENFQQSQMKPGHPE